jgi:heme exporter protein D
MNPWPFVIAAYAIALVATVVLLVTSFFSMHRAEAEAERLRERK